MIRRRSRRATTRAHTPSTLLKAGAGTALAMAALAPGAARAQALVDACNLGVALPALTQVGGALDPLLGGLVGGINGNVVDVLSNRTLQVGVRNATTGAVSLVAPGNCHLAASSLNVDAAQGVSIGGGRTTGLGASGAVAAAGHVSAIALGNGASTGPGLAGAVAFGTGASSTVVGGVALGSGAVAGRAGLSGAAEAFSAAAVASAAGAVSVGALGAERQITNLAGGTAATDAVNLRQLTAVGANLAASLGAGAAFNAAAGVYVNPGFTIRGTLYGDVGAALSAIDLRLGAATGGVVNNITVTGGAATGGSGAGGSGAGGTTTVVDNGVVRQDAATRTITVGGGTDGRIVNVAGTEGDRRITGVAQATANNDAVNLAQLSAAELRLTTMVSDVPIRGSNTAGRPAPAASGSDALAVGYGAAAAGAGAVAIGNGSSAAQANAVAIGAGATTTRANQVAVGTARSTYTLAGLPSAESAAAQSGPTRFVTTDESGNLAASKYGPGAVAALDGRVGAVEAKMAGVVKYATEGRREARQGVAAAMAMTSASMPSLPGRTSWVMNSSTFRGEWAAGGAMAHRLDTNVPLAVQAGYAYGGGNSHGVRVGLGGEF